MQIMRFNARDMRDALRQVREALGPEAVILETQRTESGLVVAAAMDAPAGPAPATAPAAGAALGHAPVAPPAPLPPTAQVSVAAPAPDPATGALIRRLENEVGALRGLLEGELARLAWNDQVRRSARGTTILRNLARLGITPDVAQRVVTEIGEGDDASPWTAPLGRLVETIPVADDDLVTEGGVFAIVGPTGVGKTTTIAKLAARYALHGDAADIALITTDTFRIAAREQLETFGQILGVPVYQAADATRLRETLQALAGRRLVLIDTAGMGQRDVRLARQLAWVAGADERVKVLLALPANAQTTALQEIVEAFLVARPGACILTKTDEATSLGGAISVLIRGGLPLAYVANGQRVPEDLHVARARQAWLVKSALELLGRQDDINEDFMAHHFAGVNADACA